MQWGLFEISNPGFSLAENHKKSDNQPMKKQEKKTPLLDLEALHFILKGAEANLYTLRKWTVSEGIQICFRTL